MRAWLRGAAAAVITTAAIALTSPIAFADGGGAGMQLAQVEVTPTTADFPGGEMMQRLINWAGQFALWGSVASLLIGAGIWGVSQQFGNGMQSGKGKTLAASGAVGAVLTGLAAVIVNTLFTAAGG